MDRRTFLGAASAAVLGATLTPDLKRQGAPDAKAFPQRVLGKTNIKVSILGVGGQHMAKGGEENAIAIVHRALELGINFIDTADCYQGGASERYIGTALKDRRAGVYVMTKVDQRDKDSSRQTLETSLKNLQMDTIDLWQFHAVPSPVEVDRIFGPGGAMETAAEAKKEGKIRHIGITGHASPAALAHALEKYHDLLDTVQMPINAIDASFDSFAKQVIPLAVKHNVAVLAMKTGIMGKVFTKGIATPDECLRYAWSQPVALVISGMETLSNLEENAQSALAYKAMTAEEQEQIVSRVVAHAGTDLEFYKQKRKA